MATQTSANNHPVILKEKQQLRVSAKALKVAFFDLDGTIVNAEGNISPATIKAMGELEQQGVALAFATGRPLFGAKDVLEKISIKNMSLFFSGALIANPSTKEVLRQAGLEAVQAERVATWAKSRNRYCEMYTTDTFFVEKSNPNLAEMHYTYLKSYPEIASIKDTVDHFPILKLVLVCENQSEYEETVAAAKLFPELRFAYGTGAAHPDVVFCNVTSPAASRELAFDLLCKHYEASPAQIASFGDSDGDLPFIKRAGFGVAMANAPEAVQSTSGFITKSVEEDGVAFAINLLLSKDGMCRL